MTLQSESDFKAKLISASEFEEHINGSLKPKQLQDLPKELYDEIFKFLPLDDLANMSLTCIMYKLLAENYFDRIHQNEVIFICSNKTVKFNTRGERYKIRFRYFIRSIEVDFESVDMITETFLFIRQNCARDLRSLLLWSYENENEVNDTHAAIILEQLQHLEILLAKDVCVGFIMKHCKNIHTLAIYNDGLDRDRNFWITQCNPKLTTFILNYSLDDKVTFTNFLRMNPQLKAIVVKNNESAIGSLCSTEIAFEYAAVQLTDESSALSNLAKFKECWNTKSIKSLDLLMANDQNMDESFGSATLQAAFGLKLADGLHFVVSQENLNIFETIGIRSHIKRLCMKFETDLTVNVFEQMVNAFPNLNCLWVLGIYDGLSNLSIKKLIMPIISHSRKLEVIYFPSFKETRISKHDAIELNCARSKMKNASKVKIITDHCIPSKHSSVEINRCQRSDASCLVCNESLNLNNYIVEVPKFKNV